MAILVISFLKGNEERQRLMRRNIIRYVLLSYCMATRWGGGDDEEFTITEKAPNTALSLLKAPTLHYPQ